MKKIYTKGGDNGKTSLISGKRVPKYHHRVEAYGNVDELSSCIGFLRSFDIPQDKIEELIYIQQILFDIMGLLANDDEKFLRKLKTVEETSIGLIETSIDEMSEKLPVFKNFVLQGGQSEVGFIHICRSVCRRAERSITKLADKETIDANIIIFVNRLSDYFFTLSGYIAKIKNYEQKTVE